MIAVYVALVVAGFMGIGGLLTWFLMPPCECPEMAEYYRQEQARMRLLQLRVDLHYQQLMSGR